MKLLRIAGISLLALVAAVAVALAVVTTIANQRYQRTWTVHEAGFPIPFPLGDAELASLTRERLAAGAPAADPLAGVDLAAAARDSAAARGAHLVNSWVLCTGCHGPDLGGHVLIDVPVVGYWAAPNLTLGRGSVTRGFSAHQWDMAVRHGVRHTGHSSTMPAADLATLSDHELSDIVCYIRSQPAVDRSVASPRLGPVFAVMTAADPTSTMPAFKLDHQKPHAVEPPARLATPEFGQHLAQVCMGCHGPHFSGGQVAGDPDMPVVGNITPDDSGIKTWSEADFVRALREGKRPDGSAIRPEMPWKAYRFMTDTELGALYAYLRTVPPRARGTH